MRVLLWSDYYWPAIGGTEVLARHLVGGMRARGVEYQIVANSAAEGENAIAQEDGLAVHRLPLRRSLEHRATDEIVAVRRHLDEIFRRFRPELVHEISLGAGDAFLLPTRRRAGTPCLVTLQQHLPRNLLAASSAAGRALREATAIVTCSAATRTELLDAVPELAPQCTVIANAIPDAEERAAIDPPRTPRLLCLGRLVEEKGFDLAVRAFANSCARLPQAELVIAGDGPCRSPLMDLAQRLGVGERVRFTGWVDPSDRLALIDSASAVVVPSRREPFGLVALEAALRGRPVVARAVGGLMEVIRDGETGVLVSDDEVATLGAALRRLLDDPTLAARMGKRALAHGRRQFSWRAHLDAYESTYRRLSGAEV